MYVKIKSTCALSLYIIISSTGIEPAFLPWKGNVLTTIRKGLL